MKNATKKDPAIAKCGAGKLVAILEMLESDGRIQLTESGRALLSSAKAMAAQPFAAELPEADRPLAVRLREWRKGKSRQLGHSPYIILRNSRLFAVATARPSDLEQLAACGVGTKFVEKFGAEILSLIAA